MQDKPLLSIGVMAQLLGVHVRTLRIYDDEKLLIPARINGRRLYSQNDLEKGRLIQYLTRNLALNLSGVRVILGIFKELNFEVKEYAELINKISIKNNINESENILKTKKRGRKHKNA